MAEIRSMKIILSEAEDRTVRLAAERRGVSSDLLVRDILEASLNRWLRGNEGILIEIEEKQELERRSYKVPDDLET